MAIRIVTGCKGTAVDIRNVTDCTVAIRDVTDCKELVRWL